MVNDSLSYDKHAICFACLVSVCWLPDAGERFGADGDKTTATAMKAIQDAAADEAKQRLAEKAAKKAAFNAEYDVGRLSFSNSNVNVLKAYL